MSTWNLGANDISEETRNYRDKLASKDGQIAAQADRLLKQASDLEELQESLNDALHKLTFETRRALQLEDDLRHRSDDLRDERIASENIKVAFHSALEKNKGSNKELLELETTLERVSYISNEHQARNVKLEKEKSTLEARVKELEANMRAISQPTPIVPPRRIPKPRSSSLSNIRITNLEQDLNDLRSQLAAKDAEVEQLSHKVSRAQQDQDRTDNEKVATERKWHSEVKALQDALDEKEGELRFMQQHGSDGSREEELLKRIEEDGAKIEMLELMLRKGEEAKEVEERIRRSDAQLKEERQRRLQLDERFVDLAREKEEALAALHEARQEVAQLATELEERNVRDNDLDERARNSLNGCMDQILDDFHPQADAIGHIERLLATVDRLREERDALRRDFHFLESESKYTIEALEQKLASSVSVYTESDDTTKTLGQLKNEMNELHCRLAETTEEYAAKLAAKNGETWRLGLCLQGLAIALNRVSLFENQVPSSAIQASPALEEIQAALKLVNEKYETTVLSLEKMTSYRDDLLVQLQNNNMTWEKEVRVAQHEIDELKKAISELNAHIDHVESERDSLVLQVTNLTTDIQNVQDELTDAESRYTNLQFHQLSNMTSNEATRTLRGHIEELEARVMRRTEQIGIHQHDIRRLETNLRLQEERLSEMMMELEMMAAQKDAMVEDCADAREARDEALAHVEALEEELESSSENERLIIDLIAVVVDNSARAKQAIHHARSEATATKRCQEDERRSLRQQVDDQENSLKTLTQLSGQYREELEQAKGELAEKQRQIKNVSEREKEAREQLVGLEAQIMGFRQQDHDSVIRDLIQQKTELENRLQEKEKLDCANEEAKLSELKIKHAGMVASLEQRLVQSEDALEDLQSRYKSAEVDHQIASEDATLSIRKLEEELERTKQNLEQMHVSRDCLQTLEKEQMKKIDDLQAELTAISHDYQNILQERDTIAKEGIRLRDELELVQQRQKDIVADLHAEHRGSRHDLEEKMVVLQGRLDETSRLLDASKVEAARLTDRLRELTEGRAMDQRHHDVALQSAKEETRHVEERLRVSENYVSEIQTRLEQAEIQIKTAEDEKTVLEQDVTVLESQIQKQKSFNRYVDSQNKESERVISNLKGEIDHLRGKLAHFEKACKAAEVNLSLQNAQHKRETTELQRELRLRPNLEIALRELEERNNEMEVLLRGKCTEIEANDDRVLEMLKEKKKLTTKVESLNRKVQNLQAKLAVAKASSNSQQPGAELQVSTSLSVSRPRAVTVAPTPTTSASSTTTPPIRVGRNPTQRIVSGPSSLPRPKTPERNKPHVPVFKARTPEHATLDPMPANVVIGKKRAVPDDFEACENIPAQAFSADGRDAENRTPRVRRVLGNLHSSFTPNRNQNRPTIPHPSPKRPEPASSTVYMSDMTNSPFTLPPVPMSSSKPTKRSWLGKIRGTSDKPSSTRAFFMTSESS